MKLFKICGVAALMVVLGSAVGLIASGVNVLLAIAVVRPRHHEVAVLVAGHAGVALVVADKIKIAGAGRYFE